MTTFTESEKHEALYSAKSVYLEWVVQTVKDVRRSFDFLVSERNADSNRIVLMGISRGAVAGMIAAGAEERLAAFVSILGGHFDALEQGHLPAACPANYVGRISPQPLLMINGIHDADFVKDTSVQPIFRLWRESRRRSAGKIKATAGSGKLGWFFSSIGFARMLTKRSQR